MSSQGIRRCGEDLATHGERSSISTLYPMLPEPLRTSIIRVAEALVDLDPLIRVLEGPVRVVPERQVPLSSAIDGYPGQNIPVPRSTVLNHLQEHLQLPELELRFGTAVSELTVFERIVTERLSPWIADLAVSLSTRCTEDVETLLDGIVRDSVDPRLFSRHRVISFDSVSLNAYTAGLPEREAVVIVSACGMPWQLLRSWLRCLARDRFVITWESRGLFVWDDGLEPSRYDIGAQVEDLFAVMDHFGIQFAQVMGVCGGAVIALLAAAARPDRISALSLWHGDYEFGAGVPKTAQQEHLRALLSMAAGDRSMSSLIRRTICELVSNTIPRDVAHIVLYPYANGELFFRYTLLNSSIMATPADACLSSVRCRTLIVTSEDDQTTHPAGSKHLAHLLPEAVLHLRPHGDHLSLFEPGSDVLELTREFLRPSATGG
jgi:3-oxoadipate enol-lactonase